MSLLYSLSVKSAHGVQWNPGRLHGNQPNLYVRISVDGKQISRTRTVKRTMTPKWDGNVPISSGKPTAVISLKLFHDSSMLSDTCLGSVTIQLGDLVSTADANSQEASLQLTDVEGPSNGKPSGTLVVHIANLAPTQVQSAIEDAQIVVATSKLATRGRAGGLESGLNAVVKGLEVILHIGDELTEINPYAKAAWKILTFVRKAVEKQQDMDEKVLELVRTMAEVYSFVDDVESLEKVKRLKDVVVEITKQTVECAIFIREYTGHGFSVQLVRNTWSDTKEQIDGLAAALMKLKDAFDRGLAFQSVFFSAGIKADTEYLVQSEKLRALDPLNFDASLRRECLSGTRQDVLNNITGWLDTPSERGNVLWLHGVAGAGKSTISTSISQYFRSLHRLGTFLFFDRNSPAGSSPGGVIRTIAHGMAVSDPHIKAAVCKAITEDATIATAPISTQFFKLLLEPLFAAEAHICGPMIIVLDALDECGNPESRRGLLSLIVDEFPKLPLIFRFFITSRPDSDIAGQFHGQSHIVQMRLDISTASTKHDIIAYLHDSMRDIKRTKRSLEQDWPGEHIIETLADYSGGLFIWASTACKFIRSFDPKKRLAIILAAGVSNDLDELYTIALQNSADWTNEEFSRDAPSILGVIVLSRVPLTDRTIDKLLQFEDRRSADVLEYLGCVIQWTHGQAARILHASFSDYLTNPARSGGSSWSVDSRIQSRLTSGCLHILNSQLDFNICRLEDSHILNVEVPDLSNRIEAHISAELNYASLFWAHHLQDTGLDNEMLAEIKDLMNNRFLYWLEVLSLLNQMPIATEGLKITSRCVSQTDTALQNLLQDAIRFGRFSPVISQSAPHIYISALPLAPRESLVRKLFAPSFPRTLDFTGPLGNNWSSFLKVFRGHTGWVKSVAISPDGKQIASGSTDHTVRVWDSETGNVIVCNEHTEDVAIVAFSLDGRQIVSGGRDGFRFWDSKTGALVKMLGDCSDLCLAVSPDGKHLVSGSYNGNKAQLWDLTTGAMAGEFKGHTGFVSAAAFSSDGKRLASGSGDHTVRIWDTKHQTMLTGPFEGHTDFIGSVAFSPDGKLVVSGSQDLTLRVWDTATGGVLAGPWKGGGLIPSVTFSPNGKQIAASSLDNAVRIWDVRTGLVVAGPFKHVGWVNTIAFSPDGKRVVSGSSDQTIRVWDAESDNLDAKQSRGRNSTALSVIASISVSPDGQHLASGSTDGTVQIFDSKTGVLVAGPVKPINAVHSISFSPSGKQIVFAGSGGKVQVWNYQTVCATVTSFTPLGETEAPVSNEAGLDTMSIADNKYTPSSSSSASDSSSLCSFSVAFSPDGHYIVAGFSDGTIKVLNLKTGDVVTNLPKAHTGNIWGVSFSPEGRRIASGSGDGTIRVWDSATGATVVGPIFGLGISDIAFSPDGKYLASGSVDHRVRILDSKTGREVPKPFEKHTDGVESVAFSSDGMQVVSGSCDMTVRVWDWKMAGEISRTFYGHTDKVCSVAFLPNGKQVVSASFDNTIRIWKIEPLDDWGSHPSFTDGWLINSSSERILWVPPWLREGLYLPWNSLVISSRGTTKLNFSQFVHGTNWTKCREPISQRVHYGLQTAYLAD